MPFYISKLQDCKELALHLRLGLSLYHTSMLAEAKVMLSPLYYLMLCGRRVFVSRRLSCRHIRVCFEVVWAPDSSHTLHEVLVMPLLPSFRVLVYKLEEIISSCEGLSLGPGNTIKLCLAIHP